MTVLETNAVYSYRISKFDPHAPSSQRQKDWTSVSDVGRTVAGRVLTRRSYERIESKYLEAVRILFAAAAVAALRVTDVIRGTVASEASNWIADGLIVDADRALDVCRAQLREEISCHLEADNGLAIDVGLDYYLYITSPTPLDDALPRIVELGLFVEPDVPPPYVEP